LLNLRPLRFELQAVFHVLVGTAAATSEVGARRLNPAGRGLHQAPGQRPLKPASLLDNLNVQHFTGNGERNKNHLAFVPGYPVTPEGNVLNPEAG